MNGFYYKTTEYYLDIETNTLIDNYPNPLTDKIITIQYQKLYNGKPIDDLVVLKEWENSEEQILKTFYKVAWINPYDFVWVGHGLEFESCFFQEKLKKYSIANFSSWEMHNRIKIDLKDVAIIINHGILKGWNKIFDTIPEYYIKSGREIPKLYKNGKFDDIINYVKHEAESFLQVYSKLYNFLPTIKEVIK
jgi:hypothetical protein